MKKYVAAIIVLIFGIIILGIGRFFRVMHWPFGIEILGLGALVMIIAIVIFLIQMLRKKK